MLRAMSESKGKMKESSALPFGLYRDPAKVYADAQEKTCAGCGWISLVDRWVAGKPTPDKSEFCGQYERSFPFRCRQYTEKPGHAG